jgi:hypothetical protein
MIAESGFQDALLVRGAEGDYAAQLRAGPGAAAVQPPRLHSGKRLTKGQILAVGDSLKPFGLMPTAGYL